MVVDPGVAIVSLLDHLVRAPEGASLLLGMHKNQDIVDLEMRNTWLDGVALRDMRLPRNTLVLSIRRGDEWLVTQGYTRLRVGDKVTAMGSREGLDQLALQLEA